LYERTVLQQLKSRILEPGRLIYCGKNRERNKNADISKFETMFHPQASFIVGTGGIPVKEFLATDPYSLFSI